MNDNLGGCDVYMEVEGVICFPDNISASYFESIRLYPHLDLDCVQNQRNQYRPRFRYLSNDIEQERMKETKISK